MRRSFGGRWPEFLFGQTNVQTRFFHTGGRRLSREYAEWGGGMVGQTIRTGELGRLAAIEILRAYLQGLRKTCTTFCSSKPTSASLCNTTVDTRM
jgi:hypothetical protein